jgi:EAL and modified HD-GYP domain-containing signal transduction protein
MLDRLQTLADPRDSVFLARQPILDRAGTVCAYELLYRGTGTDASCPSGAPDAATAKVLHGAIMSIGLDTLTPGCPAFLNITRNLLAEDIGALLPPDAVVLEVLETIDIDDEVVEACRRLLRWATPSRWTTSSQDRRPSGSSPLRSISSWTF